MVNRIRHTREITIETHSITIIRSKGRPLSDFCERCQTTVPVFVTAQVAEFFRLSFAEVCCRIETDDFHLIGNDRRIGIICGNSFQSNGLLAKLKK